MACDGVVRNGKCENKIEEMWVLHRVKEDEIPTGTVPPPKTTFVLKDEPKAPKHTPQRVVMPAVLAFDTPARRNPIYPTVVIRRAIFDSAKQSIVIDAKKGPLGTQAALLYDIMGGQDDVMSRWHELFDATNGTLRPQLMKALEAAYAHFPNHKGGKLLAPLMIDDTPFSAYQVNDKDDTTILYCYKQDGNNDLDALIIRMRDPQKPTKTLTFRILIPDGIETFTKMELEAPRQGQQIL